VRVPVCGDWLKYRVESHMSDYPWACAAQGPVNTASDQWNVCCARCSLTRSGMMRPSRRSGWKISIWRRTGRCLLFSLARSLPRWSAFSLPRTHDYRRSGDCGLCIYRSETFRWLQILSMRNGESNQRFREVKTVGGEKVAIFRRTTANFWPRKLWVHKIWILSLKFCIWL